jgi:hypothetical protein
MELCSCRSSGPHFNNCELICCGPMSKDLSLHSAVDGSVDEF